MRRLALAAAMSRMWNVETDLLAGRCVTSSTDLCDQPAHSDAARRRQAEGTAREKRGAMAQDVARSPGTGGADADPSDQHPGDQHFG